MINAVAFSNVGNIRSNHEDNYLLGTAQCISRPTQKLMKNNLYTNTAGFSGEYGIFAVCDGMGGHSSGEIASYAAVSWLQHQNSLLLNSRSEEITTLISELNTYICNESDKTPSCNNMGCTLSAIIINGKAVHTVNVGDSRIYSFQHGKLSQISTDHTEGQRLLELGLLTYDELPGFASRKSLYKYLGRKGNLIADVTDISGNSGLYLICSDGLTDAITDDAIEKLFLAGSSVEDIGQSLLKTALGTGDLCTDNVTVLLVEIS